MQIDKDLIKSKFINHIYNQWTNSFTQFPDFLTEISSNDKITNEKFIDNALDDFRSYSHYFSKRTFLNRKKWRKKTLTMVKNALTSENIIGVHSILRDEDLDKMQNEIGKFLYKARNFERELTFSDIGQAVRNYIVYIMFKEMNHINTGFSQACFGFSMLYPFTDNYIDNTKLSANDKIIYNKMIRDKIKGEKVKANSVHQSKTCMLLDFIETEYNRNSDTSIYTLLLMMLEAQEISMTQQKISNLTEKERLNISIYKGGLSVLIDRYLINKTLTEEDIIFYLSFGFFLQLADDLLDIREDIEAGSQTIFSLDVSSEHLELLVNKLFAYVHNLFNNYTSINENFKDFVLKNCYYLILYGVSENKEVLSKAYLNKLEKCFPVHYSYLDDLKVSIQQLNATVKQSNYMKLLDDFLINYTKEL